LQYPAATVFFCPYVDYIVYADDFPNGYFQSEIKPTLTGEVAGGRARVLATVGQVRVYRRIPNPGARVGACVTPGNTHYQTLRETLGDP